MSVTTSSCRRLLLGAGAVLTVAGLAACSTQAPAAPAAQPTTTASTSSTPSTPTHTETPHDTPTTKPTHTDTTPTNTSTGGNATGGGCNDPYPVNPSAAGLDGPAFQTAMAAIGVPATGECGGKGTTGIGAMQYTFTGSGHYVVSVNCTATSESATTQQSDQNAQTLAKTFLAACAGFNQQGAAKEQAVAFVDNNLAGLQAEQPKTQPAGPVMLTLGKQAPGFYFLMVKQGG